MKNWQHLLLVLVLSMLALPAAMCTRDPSAPTPSIGGQPSAGGSSVGGATSQGGATASGGSLATGGTTSTTVERVRFPDCNQTQKVKQTDRSKLKLGRKVSQLTKHQKASYTTATNVHSAFWRSLISRPLNQRNLGACTGFAPMQVRVNLPFSLLNLPGPWVTIEDFEAVARDIYGGATKRDPWPGSWPPTDTGSNGESALDEALARGIFAGYRTIDSLAELQTALQSGPVIMGVDWYEGFFSPTRCGEAKATGAIAGGHEVAIVGVDVDDKKVWWLTSWDEDFGVCLDGHCGYGYWTYGTVSDLFSRGADAHQPVQ